MNKICRIICCLALPIFAMFGLSGCGKARTQEDIKNKYSEVMQTYKEFFTEQTGTAIVISYPDSGEIKKLNNLSIVEDKNLRNRYLSLIGMQEDVLRYAYIYYVELSENFYGNVDILGVQKDEMRTIFKNVEDLEDSLERFKVAKSKFLETVEVMTFEGVVRADLTAYSYELNLLIEQCLEFVGYFKDLNVKYLYNGEINEENKVNYAKHYMYEACYELAEVAYWRYLKAYNNITECDLCTMPQLVEKTNFDDMKGIFEVNIAETKVTQSLEDVENFREVRKSYLQKHKIYKAVYEKMDYYRYNESYVAGIEELTKYVLGQTKIEQANIVLVENFYNVTLDDYIEECKILMGV